ncbi:MAG: hypothetical protein MUF52_11705 [Syntrophobacteraceae bacterium]|jgi:hypothetical protein|nr:hypothetical protein [Syntrophobacteraceae bacterium]
MNLAIYCGSRSAWPRQLESVIDEMGSMREVSVYRDLAELGRALHRPGKQLGLIVLHADSRKDLEDMLPLKGLLQDIRTVLVVPDLDAATVSLGHSLEPRILTRADGDRGELRAILYRMVRLYAEDSGGCQAEDGTGPSPHDSRRRGKERPGRMSV